MIMLIRRKNKHLRIHMATMAGAAGHLVFDVWNLRDVILVDVLRHGIHQPRGRLLSLRVVGKVQPRSAIGPNIIGVCRVAGAALHPQRALPGFHQLVNLLPGQRLRQHLQVGGSGEGALAMLRRARGSGRLRLRSWRCLGKRCNGEGGHGQQSNGGSRQGKSIWLQVEIYLAGRIVFPMDGILLNSDAFSAQSFGTRDTIVLGKRKTQRPIDCLVDSNTSRNHQF